jgi:hypothetical protein
LAQSDDTKLRAYRLSTFATLFWPVETTIAGRGDAFDFEEAILSVWFPLPLGIFTAQR